MSIKVNTKSPFTGVVLLVIGIVMMIMGASAEKEAEEFVKNAKKTVAHVNDVKQETTREKYRKKGKTKYRTVTKHYAYLTYGTESGTYTNVKYQTSRLSKNQDVEIYYDSTNPKNIKLELPDPDSEGTILDIVGIGLLIWGGVTLFLHFKNKQQNISYM